MANKGKLINVLLILLYSGTLYNVINPMLRFENRYLSFVFVGLVMLIPIYLVIKSIRIKHMALKIIALIMTILVSLVSCIVIMIIGMNIGMISENGYDPSFEWLREVAVEDYTIDTYRLNGGAMTSYSVLVRQEKKLGLGMKLVKNIYVQDHTGDVEIQWDDDLVTIGETKIKLKKNIYF